MGRGDAGARAGLGALVGALLALLGSFTGCGARSGLTAFALDCPSFDAIVEQVELDAFVMLDSSGSMEFETDEGIPQAIALRDALASFMEQPESAGLGIAFYYFPHAREDVSDSCLSDAQCAGEVGACLPFGGLCLPSAEAGCETDADCVEQGLSGEVCYRVGRCQASPDALCFLTCPPIRTAPQTRRA